tara:strand:- start:1753 stop:2031 length:279 start_codon:yes stop_codon:yes gene_type:complete
MDNQEIDLDGNITEQRLLEMSNHFKEIMEEKERDIARIHREHKSKNSKINKMCGLIDVLYENMVHLQTDNDDHDFIMFYKVLEHLHEISENM